MQVETQNSNEQNDMQGSETPFMSKTLSMFVANDECGKGPRHVVALSQGLICMLTACHAGSLALKGCSVCLYRRLLWLQTRIREPFALAAARDHHTYCPNHPRWFSWEVVRYFQELTVDRY
jgi:hypothetical protein